MIAYGMKTVKEKMIEKICCNGCGKEITKVAEGVWEEHFHGEKTWGYLSTQDGREDSFDLCQDCYGKMLENFRLKL